ncbi:MAG: DUF2752 domain-containing protein [Vicingus serpentipes]|nr:DUF2752 domain-containing protein [Vicingus serpentipes]
MNFVNWLEENMLACPYQKYFDIACLGCGMQRSFIALLKGNIIESLSYYPALLPMLLMFFFLIAHLIFKFKKGAVWLKYQFLFVIAIVVINFVVKLLY